MRQLVRDRYPSLVAALKEKVGSLAVVRDESVIAYVPGIVLGYWGTEKEDSEDRVRISMEKKSEDKMDSRTKYHHQ